MHILSCYCRKYWTRKENKVRIYVRSLARKGLAEYVRGLFTEDGEVAGSGYSATYEGALLISPCRKCKNRIADMEGEICYLCYERIKEQEEIINNKE